MFARVPIIAKTGFSKAPETVIQNFLSCLKDWEDLNSILLNSLTMPSHLR